LKNKERQIAKDILRLYPQLGDLQESFEFDHHDFECDQYLMEIKSRDTRYKSWIIEKMKADANLLYAFSQAKMFLYITEYKGTAYVWNITKMADNHYDFNWETRKMPATTEFDNNKFVDKEVGYLYEKDATVVEML
jgi:hypothetical protein|tara:strand:+ start:249 stop:656 length:408 start_codon:yes stop_codon:yes gene_type:complete